MLQTNSFSLIAFLIIGLLTFFSAHHAMAQETDENDHSIVVDIVPPGEAPARSDSLVPGDTLKFQGLPFPLQLLNGGELHLPEEAVVEDIRLEISLPDFTEISETAPQEVGFGRNIANAIEINVYVNDELVSPYEFAEPVELTLPIPQNLPEGIGSDVSEFVLSYVRDDEDFDPEGISTTVSDTVKGLVSARVEHFSSIAMTSEQIITETDENDHSIVVDIVPPGEAPARSDSLVPGDTLKFQGLPFPLQLLNGGELHLPEEAVVEDIRLEISLPDFTEISETAPQEVGFGRDIANAIEINVYVNDELVSPYEFAEPVELTLPIPENLPQGIGADVSEFVLAYVRDDEDFDPEGISTTVSDTVKGLVSARVEHFSSIAMTSEQTITGAEDESTMPTHVQLDQNYPNPFNPVTVITYHLPTESDVVLEVYDMLGRRVTTLVNDRVPAGQHDVSFDASDLSSGVYIYRLQAGNHTQTRQMTLIK